MASTGGISAHVVETIEEQRKQYKQNNNVIYVPNFFTEKAWKEIYEETQRLWKVPNLEPNCNLDGKNRLGGYILDHLAEDSSMYKYIYGNDDFRKWVQYVNGAGEMWPSDFPIE